MKKSPYIVIPVLLCFLGNCFAGTIYSFEDGIVPSVFKTKKGNLSVQSQKAKLGSKALQWNWVGGDTLIGAPASLNTASIQVSGGINTWIYNENPSSQKLILHFLEYETSTTRRCSLEVNLNFKGWRCIWARFRADMGHPGYTLRCMKWEAPKTGSGSILIDFLEFVNDVSWERISDFQYSVKNPSTELENFVEIRNTNPAQLPASVTGEERLSLQTLKKRVDEWHLGSGTFPTNPYYNTRKNAFDNYVRTGVGKSATLSLTTLADGTVAGPGLFPLDYYDQTVDGVSTLTFRDINEKYMVQLAYDAIKNNNSTSRELLLKIFDWYYDQGWADGSALGRLRFEMLRSSGFYHAAYLMRNIMPEAQFTRITNAWKWYSMFGKIDQPITTPGQSADQIRTLLLPKLMLILSLKNEAEQVAELRSLVKYANNALALAGGYLDCLKPDYSGYHHRGAYYSAYYTEALYAGSLFYSFLAGTSFALSPETFSNLKNSLLTFRFICADYNVPAGTTGRFPTQTQVLDNILPAYAYMALSTPVPDPELTAAFIRLWKPDSEPVKSLVARVKSDITFKNTLGEVEKMIELAGSNIIAEQNPVGTKFMPYSGLLVSRLPNWAVTVKGFSKYIWDFEASSTENRYGRYLSYGHLEVSKLNAAIRSYNPSSADWDWSHIPGTTAKYLTKTELDFQLGTGEHRNFSDNPFLGGIAFSNFVSVFSNSIHDNTFDKGFYAKKSVFQFDSIYYCLGSGIRNSDRNHFVHTTLFQNLNLTTADQIVVNDTALTASVTGKVNPVVKDNYGNTYIVRNGNVNVDASTSLLTAYINHGRTLANAKYAYLLVPNASNTDISMIQNSGNSLIEVLQHDTVAHSIVYKPGKTQSTVVFNASNDLNIGKLRRVNIPSIVVLQERNDTLELAFTDPDMHRPSAASIDKLTAADEATPGSSSSIEIVLNGKYEKIGLDTGISVSNDAAATTIRYDNAVDGRTYRVLLRDIKTTLKNNETSGLRARYFKRNNLISIENKPGEVYCYRLFDAGGQLITSKSNISVPVTIATGNLGCGTYLLYINSNSDNNCLKFTH